MKMRAPSDVCGSAILKMGFFDGIQNRKGVRSPIIQKSALAMIKEAFCAGSSWIDSVISLIEKNLRRFKAEATDSE